MRAVLAFVFLLVGIRAGAQAIVSSNTSVRTTINNSECSMVNSSSYLFYDETKNAFYLKVDFNSLKVGVDSIDYWLEDLDDTYLYFKAPLRKEDFPPLSNNNARTYKINGQLYLNHIWNNQSIELSIFSTENSQLNYSQSANRYANYKVNFGFSIVPREFKLHRKPSQLKNPIFVSIGMGQINLLQPGMESAIQEAYDH